MNQQQWFFNDSMKSPEYKFSFNNNMYQNFNTPTPLNKARTFSFDQNKFNFLQPSPMNHPIMQASPSINFNKNQISNCFVFPAPNPAPMPEENKNKEYVTFGPHNESMTTGQTHNDTPPKTAAPKKQNKTTKRKNLSVREDVMNKNIFRAFKRELKTMYTEYLGDLSNCDDKEQARVKFLNSSGTFTEQIIKNSSIDPKNFCGFNMDVCKTYVGIFLDYCQMKKIVKVDADKERLSTTFNVIYSYSHQKFYEFLEIPEIKVIFRVIMAKTGIEKFISHHDSLHKEKYSNHINQLMEKL